MSRVSVDTVAEYVVLTEAKMRAQYSDVITRLGENETEYHIEVDSNVTTVIQRCIIRTLVDLGPYAWHTYSIPITC